MHIAMSQMSGNHYYSRVSWFLLRFHILENIRLELAREGEDEEKISGMANDQQPSN